MKTVLVIIILALTLVMAGVVEQVKAEAFAEGYWYGWQARG